MRNVTFGFVTLLFFLPLQGFCPEAKIGGGALEFPACIYTRNLLMKKRSKNCVCSMGRFPDLMKLGTHGGVG